MNQLDILSALLKVFTENILPVFFAHLRVWDSDFNHRVVKEKIVKQFQGPFSQLGNHLMQKIIVFSKKLEGAGMSATQIQKVFNKILNFDTTKQSEMTILQQFEQLRQLAELTDQDITRRVTDMIPGFSNLTQTFVDIKNSFAALYAPLNNNIDEARRFATERNVSEECFQRWLSSFDIFVREHSQALVQLLVAKYPAVCMTSPELIANDSRCKKMAADYAMELTINWENPNASVSTVSLPADQSGSGSLPGYGATTANRSAEKEKSRADEPDTASECGSGHETNCLIC